MNTSTLLFGIIVLLGCIIVMLWLTPQQNTRVIINSSYPETDNINIQRWIPTNLGIHGWNLISHPYANNFGHRPLQFGHHVRR
jgi:hypothetical protein